MPLRTASPLRVGLAWAANSWHARRSLPLALLADALTNIPNVAWYALQHGPERDQLATCPLPVEDTPPLDDVLATARLLRQLDLVITVDTLVAHLAGTLGVPTWVLLLHDADWRWLHGRNDSPWYPSVRLFRQPQPGDWPSVVQRIGRELRAHPSCRSTTAGSIRPARRAGQ